MFCQNCGNELTENAVVCVKCGVGIAPISTKSKKGHISVPIISLIMGIIGISTFFDESGWDYETIIGCIMLYSIMPIILGIITISNNHDGKGMGVAGLIMGIISGLVYLSLLGDYM